MNIFARIAQMESSRIVGGRAQTQALLRAPDLTSRRASTGNQQRGGSHAEQNTRSAIPLPAGSLRSIPPLEFSNFVQAMLDSIALLAWISLLGLLIGSLPLAIFLMIFAGF